LIAFVTLGAGGSILMQEPSQIIRAEKADVCRSLQVLMKQG
jgi:hypothetical protein